MATTLTSPQPSPYRNVPAYGLFLLFLANALNIADRTLLGIVVDPVGRDLALSDTQMSFVSGFAFVAFNLIVGIFIASWVDRGNRKLILVGGIALWSLGTASSGLAQGFGTLAVSRMVVGVGEATAFPVALSMIADLFTASRRPRAVAIFQVSTFVGIAGGSIFAGMLAAAHGWRWMFAVCGVAGFFLVVVILLTMRDPVRGQNDAPTAMPLVRTGLGRSLATILRLPGFGWLAAGYGLSGMVVGALPTWGPAFFLRSHAVPLAEVGAIIGPPVALGGLVGTLGAGFVATALVRRTGREASALLVPIIGLVLAAPCFAGMLLLKDLRMVQLSIGLANMLLGTALGPCLAIAVGLAPTNTRGVASTIMLIAQGLIGSALAPFIVGVASDALAPSLGAESLRYSLALLTVAPALASAAIWIAYRHIGNGEARRAPAPFTRRGIIAAAMAEDAGLPAMRCVGRRRRQRMSLRR